MTLLRLKKLSEIEFDIQTHLAKPSYIAKGHGPGEIIIQGTSENLARRAGFKALHALLKKDYYQNLTIFDAVAQYVPTEDKNDVKNYRKILKQVTKLDLETKIKDLTYEQFLLLCQAVQRVEGFKVGETTEEKSKKKILEVKKNKQNLIIQYLIEGYGWLHKTKAIILVEKNIVDAVIVKRQNGSIFLRSRPDNTKTNNLDK